jgi:hypothetical protein
MCTLNSFIMHVLSTGIFHGTPSLARLASPAHAMVACVHCCPPKQPLNLPNPAPRGRTVSTVNKAGSVTDDWDMGSRTLGYFLGNPIACMLARGGGADVELCLPAARGSPVSTNARSP